MTKSLIWAMYCTAVEPVRLSSASIYVCMYIYMTSTAKPAVALTGCQRSDSNLL